ncbi:MAG TPA: thioredoxin family protein [Methanocella sp.]|uniref:thioredoxin family protein n=1 Tax=Methanocella sp. TaxID=2052833 RepID=UPI002C53E8A7|nr:thioredoxin family protein [Methanocella sp.]HTY92224.1 thioredoxin family protein [Methanocella sp.]
MKSRALILIMLAALMTGCVSGGQNGSAGSDGALAGIDAALDSGPVFVDFGAPWCTWCTQEEPIIEELKAEYPGVTFIGVNIDENGTLADAFYVDGIPQMDVVVKKNSDGSYLYADVSGSTTANRRASAIIGYHEKADLEKALDAAVKARG